MTDPSPPDNNRGAVAALIFVVVLVIGGFWLFHELQSHNETLNCVASGRRDCSGDLMHPDAPQ